MIIYKNRYFKNANNEKQLEVVMWALAGTNEVAINDPRLVAIGERVPSPTNGQLIDSWFPLKASNLCADTAGSVVYEMVTKMIMDNIPSSPTFRKMIERQVPVKTLHIDLDYYNMPIKAGLTEITETEFNNMA